jgi:L-lactate utilization protein LutC
MKRESILRRLLQATENVHSPKLQAFPEFPNLTDLTAKFRLALEAVQGVVLPGFSTEEKTNAFQRILTETEAERICWENLGILDEYSLPFSWIGEPVEDTNTMICSHHPKSQFSTPMRVDIQATDRNSLSEVAISVSEGLWAIAETGSVLESTGPGKSRILPILAPVHIILLKQSRILPTQADFFQLPELGKSGSAQIIMTGPSRTADIEKVLALGVHGPEKLFVILV